jgi:hypothetical protein
MNEQTKKEIDFLYHLALIHNIDDIQAMVRFRIKELAQTCPECHGEGRIEKQLCICQL